MESNEIKKIIPYDDLWNNLKDLENRLIEVSSSENEYLSSISQYLIKAGGKRFRPIVSLLSGKFGDEKKNLTTAAATATLESNRRSYKWTDYSCN